MTDFNFYYFFINLLNDFLFFYSDSWLQYPSFLTLRSTLYAIRYTIYLYDNNNLILPRYVKMILEEFKLGWSAIYWNHPEDEFVIEMDRPVLILNSIRSERDNPFSLCWYKTKLPQGDPAQTLLKN